MSTSPDFGELRSLVAGRPSEAVFDELCERLDTMALSAREVDYLAAHLARWPERVRRRVPLGWVTDLLDGRGEHSCLWLCTALAFKFQELAYRDLFRRWGSWPGLAHVGVVDLRYTDIGDQGAAVLAESALVAQLRALRLHFVGLTSEGAVALAACPHLAELRALTISSNAIGNRGAVALAESPYLAGLGQLGLDGNGIGDEGALALAGSPHLARLTVLSLRGNAIGHEGRQALATSPYLAASVRLHLGDTPPPS